MGIARALIGVGNYNNPAYCLKNNKVDLSEACETDNFVRYYLTHICKNYDRFFTESAKAYAVQMKEEAESFFNNFVQNINNNCMFKSDLKKHLED